MTRVQTMNADEAATAGRLLGLSSDEVALLQVPPSKPRPERLRVKVTMHGKFMPYRRW